MLGVIESEAILLIVVSGIASSLLPAKRKVNRLVSWDLTVIFLLQSEHDLHAKIHTKNTFC